MITILALITGSLVVDWPAILPREKLNSTVHDLSAAIYGARSDAISRNGVYRIYYDLDANSYRITAPFRIGGGTAQSEEERAVLRQVVFPEGIDLVRVTIDGVEYTEGQVCVSFDPLGSASDHLITIAQSTLGPVGTTYTIEVLPLTGTIRFHYEDFRREPVDESDFT